MLHRPRGGANHLQLVRRESLAHRPATVVVVPRVQVGQPRQASGPRRRVVEAEALKEARGAVERAEAGDIQMLQHRVTTGRGQLHRGGVRVLRRGIHRLHHTRRHHHRPPLLQAPHQVLVAAMEEAGAVVQRELVGTNRNLRRM